MKTKAIAIPSKIQTPFHQVLGTEYDLIRKRKGVVLKNEPGYMIMLYAHRNRLQITWRERTYEN